MQIYTTLVQNDLGAIPAEIARIEAAGYDGVLTQENRHDPFLPLGVAAVHSQGLQLGTGVAIAFPRSPMVMANIGWDLQLASSGRFELGIGTQVKGHNERRFSVPWSAPVPRLKEYIGSLRAIWQSWKTGEPLAFQGEHYQFTLMTPNFTPEPMAFAPPPITMAAVGPAMLRLAGEVADGVRLHAFCTRKYFENTVLPELQTGLSRAGRSRESLQVSGGGFVVSGATDEEVAASVEFHRQRIAFYGSTRAYWPVLEQHDLLDVGEQLNDMAKNNQWRDMPAVVSDDMLQLFCAIGRHDQIASEIERQFGGLADALSDSASYDTPGQLPAAVIDDIQAIETRFSGFNGNLEPAR
ncbi:TIGR03617 family F420-dependent LLM class oxidoreductase [Pseudohalioglobus lutimaris]|uniref:TIGR03617 family F420-dependent LLM class oxidoreductase n=1 Tax=Pseudohalioglobus lutimaris TaxID=1737061 RepID=A0A2N5X3B8_9GAMM|nr:TIGR03617 family F420-dependent LLM class oxidoreductase [Pseudohalioglobus lutimaris]PLW68977.1 TIGR03617 family F420-dependent LLM class oxidoreductase [Pseudohalioglobus lutimaris]